MQVVLGNMQAMLKRLQESFKWHLSQSETQVPWEWLCSPLHDPSTSEERITEFSSHEDSGPETAVKMALMISTLSTGAGQVDCHIMFTGHGDYTITVHLGPIDSALACQSLFTNYHAHSGGRWRSRKIKREKRKKRKSRRRW